MNMKTLIGKLIAAYHVLTKSNVMVFTMGKDEEDGFSLVGTYDKEFVYSVIDYLNECIEYDKKLN